MRSDINTQEDRDELFVLYESRILPRNADAIAEIASLIQELPSVLVCLEADPRQCHRTRLAKAVAEFTKLTVRDLRDQDKC